MNAWAFIERIFSGLLGGFLCALVWWPMDRLIFGDYHDLQYYLAVVCAYAAGTRPFSQEPRP